MSNNYNEDKQEIITIQIGNYSNFIGSHYWNIQEENYQYSKREQLQYEIDPEILFRSNNNYSTLDKDIKYTPRLLLFDFKSNFGSMNSEGRIFKQSNSNIDNNDLFSKGSTGNKFISEPTGKPIDRDNPNIDNSNTNFEYWSDYLNVDFNSKSLISIPDSLLSTTTNGNNSDWNNLNFEDGQTIMESNYDLITELYQDNLRRIIEECDHLSGFQCLIDTDGVWGGISTEVLSHLQDEYSSKAITTFASTEFNQSIDNGDDEIIDERIYNTAKSIQSIAPSNSTGLTDLYIPLSSQRWWSNNNSIKSFGNYIKKTKYQTSAGIAASIDTATLYYRSNYSSQTISSFVSTLTSTPSRKLAILSSSFPLNTQEFGFSYSSKHGREPNLPKQPLYSHPLMNYLSPRIIPQNSNNNNSNPLNEIISIRGIDIFKSLEYEDRIEIKNNYDIISSLLRMYLTNTYSGNGRSVLNRSIVNIVQPFIMKKNQFPILSNTQLINQQQKQLLQETGDINAKIEQPENPKTILTHLQNSNLIHPFIQYINNGYKKITQTKKMKRLILDQDSFSETIETLNYLSDSYTE